MALAKTVTRKFQTDNEIGFHLVVTDDDRPDLGEGAQLVVNEIFTRNIFANADMSNEVQQ